MPITIAAGAALAGASLVIPEWRRGSPSIRRIRRCRFIVPGTGAEGGLVQACLVAAGIVGWRAP